MFLSALFLYTTYCNVLCSCSSRRFWRVPSLCYMYWKERRGISRNAPGQTPRPRQLELAPPSTTPSNIKLNFCCIIMSLLWMNEVLYLHNQVTQRTKICGVAKTGHCLANLNHCATIAWFGVLATRKLIFTCKQFYMVIKKVHKFSSSLDEVKQSIFTTEG